MGFSKAITTCFSKYATFSGRAPRSEYWFFWLFGIVAFFVGDLIGIAGRTRLVGLLVELVLLSPSLAVSVRRLHDIGRTGWWLLIALIPAVGVATLLALYDADLIASDRLWWFWIYVNGFVALVIWIVLLVWNCTRGTAGPNRYGLDPLAGAPGEASA